MKKFLFLMALVLPMTILALSCGGNTPTGSSNTPTPTPTPSVKTFASSFTAFTSGVSIYGLCTDGSGNLYAANYNSSNTASNLMKIDSSAAATSITQMNGLQAVASDGTNVYGTSQANSPYFYKYNGISVTNPITTSSSLQGVAVNSNATTIAVDSGSAVTLYSLPGFTNPQAIALAGSASGNQSLAFDGSGNLYVAEGNFIVKYTAGASGSTTIAGTGTSGYKDGLGTAAAFNLIRAIASDSAGNIYVADDSNLAIRKVATDGTVTTLVGPSGANAAPAFLTPTLSGANYGIAVDGSGNVFFSDQNLNTTYNSVVLSGSAVFEYVP